MGLSFATERQAKVVELNLAGDRERIRLWASQHALELLRRALLEREVIAPAHPSFLA